MVQFASAFPDFRIVVTLSRQLGWSHFVAILPLKDRLQREFYAEMCRVERWSVRILRRKIQGMLFERTALSRKPAKLARRELKALRREDRMTPDLVFKDPYLLDFLGLKDRYMERDLEDAIRNPLKVHAAMRYWDYGVKCSPADQAAEWVELRDPLRARWSV
jgi:hypothetical protein